MKHRITLAAATLLLVPVFALVPVVAYAQDETTSGDSSQTVTQTTETKVEDNPDPKSEVFKQRLLNRKNALQERLTNAQKDRLKLRCKAAQGLISRVKGRINGIVTSRENVYKGIVTRLKELVTKLEAEGIDTTELESEITTLEQKIATFNTDLANYKQAVVDLVAMDCEADPEAFKASLEEARSLLAKVKADAADIRSYVKDTIKPTLAEIKQQLEAGSESETEGSN